MRTFPSAALAALASLAILTPAARGASAQCVPSTLVAPIEADAWIDANSPTANKGADGVLSVGDTTRALVRFRLPGGGVPQGCVVESARLRLYADSGSEGARVSVAPLASAWAEGSVTWSNQPAAPGPAVAAWSRDGYMRWNVTELVPAMLAGPNHGFLVQDAAEGTESAGGHGFYAREKGEHPPELVIRFAAPPTGEPLPPAPPVPARVRCGQLLTESTLLTHDLENCDGDGLVIGAPRIIVDLGGHIVDGVGLGTGLRNEGYADVTVRDGTVREFDRGVELLEETTGNRIERLHAHDNEVAAIELFDADANVVRENVVEGNGGGVLLVSGTSRSTVSGNTMRSNFGPGVLLQDADTNHLEGNRVLGGGDLGLGLERSSHNTLIGNDVSDTSDGGIELADGSHGNRVEGSVVVGAGDTGIMVSESDRTVLVANTTVGMSDSGITLNAANDGVVADNRVGGNPGGLQMDGSSRNLVERNDAGDGSGIGIELGGDSFANTLRFNTANGNGAQGIYVGDEAILEPGNVLHRNTANDNGSDGITIAKGGHTLTANVALRNRGWGLNAVGLNVAARNVATDNGQADDCLGIACSLPDVFAPDTALVSAPDALSGIGDAAFAFAADESYVTFECALDGSALAPCESPREYAGLADGPHEFRVQATDEFGNAEANPATHRWTVDTTPPDTRIESGPDEVTPVTAATLTFSSDEPDAAFECALDDAAFEPCSSPASLTVLSDGEHRFQVRAIDAAGNADPTPATHLWTIRDSAPETKLESGPPAVTSASSATFTFSADEPGAAFECALDDAAFAPCLSPAEYVGLVSGQHEFRVRAVDAAGATDASPAALAWTIDLIPPQTLIDDGPDPTTTDRSATFEFESDEPSSFECALDGTAFAACKSPVEFTELAPGSHEFQVRAADTAGNVDATPAVLRWTIEDVADTTPPETEIGSGPDALTAATTARFTFSADERSTFECALDDADFTACTSPAEYVDLNSGAHELRVRATDTAGNVDATPATHRWTVDLTAPATTLDSAPPTMTSETTSRFTFSTDENSTFECALDDADFAVCESPVEFVDLASGDHVFRVRAIDAAGNVDATPASHRWTVDLTAPETTLDSAPPTMTSETTARFAFSADERSTFECALDDADFTACTSPADYVDLSSAEHEFRVRATDTAGNVDATPATHRWTVDLTAPDTTLDSAPPVVTSETTSRFTFSADERSTFECALDGADFAVCESPVEFVDLASGEHVFRVRATDTAGNVDATPTVHQWSVERTAPQTTIVSGPEAITSATTATFTFSADEPGSFECALDDADFTACASPAEYVDLASAEHEFRVRATDTVGNVDTTPATHRWTVDLTAPQTTLDSAPPTVTSETTARFTFSADERSTFRCALDGADFAVCESPVELVDLASGEHVFRVRATDTAGNVDATPATHRWTVDLTAPATTLDTSPPIVTSETTARFTFSADEPSTFECALDGADFAVCESPVEYRDLAPGEHVFRARAIDAAGNVDATPATYRWTVDLAVPQTTLDSAPPVVTSETTARFTFSADEPSTFECALDDADFAACESPAEYRDLAPGDHVLRVRAIDAAGNVDATPATYRWSIEVVADTTPPQTTIDSGPASVTSIASARFAFSADEPARFECSLDERAFEPCTEPAGYDGLTDGEHTFRVRAVDAAGNVDPVPADYRWTIDATAPGTVLEAAPEQLTNKTTASFVFASDEAEATFECALDDGEFAPCESPREYRDLAAGDHSFRARAIDAARNADATPVTHTWTIDRTAPETAVDAGPRPLTNDASATFTFSSAEADATFECSLDGAAFVRCGSPQDYTALAAGDHAFRVRAIDRAGNVDDTPAGRTWRIDLEAPETRIESAPPTSTTSAIARFSFSASEPGATFACALDGAPLTACGSPVDLTALVPGRHEFRVRAMDAAGNADASPAAHTWTVQPPSACVTSTVTARAAADTWILETSPTSNYRQDSALKVDSKARARARALLTFALPPIPGGCEVTQARLRLYAGSYKASRTLTAARLVDPWTEAGVTWANQPRAEGGAATAASGSGYRDWVVTSHVRTMYTSGNHGFVIADAAEGDAGVEQVFNSREKGSDGPPQLVLTYG